MRCLYGDDASCTTTRWRQESSLSGCRWSQHFSQHLCSGNLTEWIRRKREGVSSAGGHTSSLQHKSSVFLFYHNTLEQRGHLRWRRDESTPHGGEILVFVFFFEQNDCSTPHAGTSHIKGSQTITPLDKHRPLCCYVIISKFVVTEKSSHHWLGWTNPGARWGVLEQGTYSLPAAVEAQWPTDRSTGGLGGCRRHDRPHRCSHVWKRLWMCPVGWCNMSPLYTTCISPLPHSCGALLLIPPRPSSILRLPLHQAVDVLGIFQVWTSRAYSHLPILRNSQPVSERNNNWQVGQNFRDPVVTDWFLN